MELNVFPKPAVAGLLRERFVEARLHSEAGDHIKELQQKMTGSLALPIYAIVDPKTDAVRATRAGYQNLDDFVAFLESVPR
jgi:hypothetical protein